MNNYENIFGNYWNQVVGGKIESFESGKSENLNGTPRIRFPFMLSKFIYR